MREQVDRAREERRAANMIWNAAGDYSFRPEFWAFDRAGRADLYLNSIIGAAHRLYGVMQVPILFRPFRGAADENLYENLLWLGLENCVFEKERKVRPALEELRLSYARRLTADAAARPDQSLIEALCTAHYQRALGEEPRLSARESRILGELEFDASMDAEQIGSRMERILREYFGFSVKRAGGRPDGLLHRKKWGGSASGYLSGVRRLEAAGEAQESRELRERLREKMRRALDFAQTGRREQELRDSMERCYGRSLLSPDERERLEKRLCVGNHSGCLIHVTGGEFRFREPEAGGERSWRKELLLQETRSREAYRRNLAQNKNAVARLSSRLGNCLMVNLAPSPARSASGILEAGRVWQKVYTGDEKVFAGRRTGGEAGLTVDILLDASASHRNRQEGIAVQAYIIAESLTRLSIPVRVSSFCSVDGCTVLRVFRDYGEREKNDAIFSYFASGWNRDGLAIRAVGSWMEEEEGEHKLLILLSDVRPDDIRRIPGKGTFACGREYRDETAVCDTAGEVKRLRRLGIEVLCIFTGREENLAAAKRIYGNNVVQISSVGQFADAVGRAVQAVIRNL